MEKRKQKLIRRETVRGERDEYEYSLYEGESSQTASYGLSLYSISVNQTKADGAVLSSEINDAFSDRGKALSFFDGLVENLISPFNLSYIFDLNMAKT